MRMYMLYNLKLRKEEIVANANGSTFLEISKGRFRKMKMIVPSNGVLSQFEDRCGTLFESVYNLEIQNKNLTRQRDLLLPRLMSGKLEVKP
jgi:type I restriction enzyme S subunit